MIRHARKGVDSIIITRLVFLVVVATLMIGYAKSGEAEVKKLRWALFFSKASSSGIHCREFAENVKKFTNGTVELQIFYEGEIAQTKELVDLCRTGSLDMITSPPVYHTSLFPLNSVLQTYPPLIPTVEIEIPIWKAVEKEIPEITEEYTAQNLKVLTRGQIGRYWTISKKPIRSLNDLKGMKIRTVGGKWPSQLLASGGAVAVFLPSVEIYEGLLRGTIDATTGNLGMIKSYRLYEPAKFIGFPFGGIIAYYHAVNLDVWKGLSPEVKQAFQRAADIYDKNDLQRIQKEDRDFERDLKSEGCAFIEFPKKDWNDLLTRTGDPMDGVKAELKAMGKGEAAERMAKVWARVLKEHGY